MARPIAACTCRPHAVVIVLDWRELAGFSGCDGNAAAGSAVMRTANCLPHAAHAHEKPPPRCTMIAAGVDDVVRLLTIASGLLLAAD